LTKLLFLGPVSAAMPNQDGTCIDAVGPEELAVMNVKAAIAAVPHDDQEVLDVLQLHRQETQAVCQATPWVAQFNQPVSWILGYCRHRERKRRGHHAAPRRITRYGWRANPGSSWSEHDLHDRPCHQAVHIFPQVVVV
jgi:hypothetical protein